MKIRSIAALCAVLALIPTLAFAQTSTTTTTTAPKKPSLMQQLKAKMAMHKAASKTKAAAINAATPKTGSAGTTYISSGNIIGNKSTKVYHMPGDKNLPNINNRVYFKTVAQATAAGYHAAGKGGKKAGSKMKTTGAKMSAGH